MSRSSTSDRDRDSDGLEKEVGRHRPDHEPHEDSDGLEKEAGRHYEPHEDFNGKDDATFDEHVYTERDPTPKDGADGAALSMVSSRPSVNNIKSVPNGGTRAWLQVLSSFFVFFNTWGIVNAVRSTLTPSR